MLASKNTQSSLKSLPQSTVVMATYSNNFEGANLNQSSAVTRKVLRSKLPPVAREFSWGGAFALGFERNCDKTQALFDRGGRVY